MKTIIQLLFLIIFLVSCGDSSFEIALSKITDPNLAQCIKSNEKTILDEIPSLECDNAGIKQIDGLENFTSLRILDLDGNDITDISSIANLTSLNALTINGNNISNLPVLSNLTSLTFLNLVANQIFDLTELSNLTSLTTMGLNKNSAKRPYHFWWQQY